MHRPHTSDFREFSVANPRYPKISWATKVTKKFSKFRSVFSLLYIQLNLENFQQHRRSMSWATKLTKIHKSHKHSSKVSSVFTLLYTQTLQLRFEKYQRHRRGMSWATKMTKKSQKSARYWIYCIHRLYSWFSRNSSGAAEASKNIMSNKNDEYFSKVSSVPNLLLGRCNALKHTVPHCDILQHAAAHSNNDEHFPQVCSARYPMYCVHTLYSTATHCNTLQHTATHYNTLQHTATHIHYTADVREFSCENFQHRHRDVQRHHEQQCSWKFLKSQFLSRCLH